MLVRELDEMTGHSIAQLQSRADSTDNDYGSMAVLLVSCDSYSDLWPLCTSMLKRFWSDCPYPIYLVSNETASIEGLRNLAVGRDRGWSANLISALESVPEEYVFLFLEDLILERPVDTDGFIRVFDWFKAQQGSCLRMRPVPSPDQPCNEMVGICTKGSLYRASTVMTVWRKSVLLPLLDPHESAWEFEIRGSERSDRFDGFYVTHRPLFAVVNTVARGRWSRRAIRRIRRLGFEPDLSVRETLSLFAEWKGRILEIRSALLRMMPAQYRRSIRRMLLG